MPGAADRRAAWLRGLDTEAHVAALLEERGWSILARNWRGRGGELDIVALRDGQLRMVEVKQRSADDLVGLECVDHSKQRKLTRAARAWLELHDPEFDEVCFAVAWVEGERLSWFDDAFDAVS